MAIDNDSLITHSEYMKMREEAITRLRAARNNGNGTCTLADSRTLVNIAEKDLLTSVERN